ncbi:unnamed protein product [Porites lobata]|uniref:Uncharacterized protein n=1 Tax=Porites lobata TaxID=104759 RepID=A0ABN8NSE9_9CNID|nr:unnamed protein product [Porites lobata]
MVFCEIFFIGTLAAFTLLEVYLFRRFCLARGPISKSEHAYRVPGGYYVVRYYPDENGIRISGARGRKLLRVIHSLEGSLSRVANTMVIDTFADKDSPHAGHKINY